MDGLTRTEAMDWLKATETATLVLERISEVTPPARQLQQSSQYSSFEGVCHYYIIKTLKRFFSTPQYYFNSTLIIISIII